MDAQRALSMVAIAAIAYYAGFFVTLVLAAVGSGLGGLAGVPSGMPFDPAYQSWWVARRSGVVFGLVTAAVATAIHARIAERRGDHAWRAGAVLAMLIAAAQPFLQYAFLRQGVVGRFNRGDNSAIGALQNLGMQDQLPTAIARLRAGGPDAFEIAKSTGYFSGGPEELRRVALDRTAPPAARLSAALAFSGVRNDAELREVVDEVIRESDTNFRVSVPRRISAADGTLDPEHTRAIRRQLLRDDSPRVRRAMLESEWWSCEDLPPLLDDPAADVRGPALANFRKCHTEEPKSEAVRAERIALYRALLEHSSLEVKLRAGWVLSRLGDTSGTEVALQFLKGDPYGKETTLLAYAMETARRNTRERSAAMLYTIAMCDRARNPRGHYPGARHAAEQELNQLFGYDKWPPPYRRDTAVEEAMLPEFCVPID